MSHESEKVTCVDKRNQHVLVPSKTWISYESVRTPTHFSLPRVYTSTHNDDRKEIYVFTGSEQNKDMLSEPEPVNVQSQVTGKWRKNSSSGKYEIHLKVIVSSQKNPQAVIRNSIFCENMSMVLEAIALSEQGLLLKYPDFREVKIFITFESIDKKYNREEYWGKLRRWVS